MADTLLPGIPASSILAHLRETLGEGMSNTEFGVLWSELSKEDKESFRALARDELNAGVKVGYRSLT